MPVGLRGARELPGAPSPVPISDAAAVGVLVVLELAAVWLVLRIWREPDGSAAWRLLWSFVPLVPVLGLIAWAVWRDPPPLKDSHRPPHPPRRGRRRLTAAREDGAAQPGAVAVAR